MGLAGKGLAGKDLAGRGLAGTVHLAVAGRSSPCWAVAGSSWRLVEGTHRTVESAGGTAGCMQVLGPMGLEPRRSRREGRR